MRIRLALLVVVLASLACTANVTPLSSAPSPTPVNPPTTMVEDTQVPSTLTPTAMANPTDIFTATKSANGTEAVTTPGNSGIVPIHFAPNGTYVDILDSLAAGTSKTYSIHALKGQIMSVSVHQGSDENWSVIPIKVTSGDGTTLCPTQPNTSCYFWRGALPATQDYFVTLTPDISVSDFTLRVAVNPPGTANQSFTYASHDQHTVFQYSDEFAPVRFGDIQVYKIAPELTLEFINSDFYTNTNLVEAYYLYGSSTDSNIVAGCTQPLSSGGPETVIDHVTVNSVDFVHSEAVGAGAGNLYDTIYYRTLQNNVCYEITFFIHSGNIGNYPPNVKEFNRAALLQKFQDVLSTLSIK